MSGSNSSNPGSGGSARRAEAAAAEPLSFAVHSLPAPTLPSAAVRHGRLKMLLVLLVCAAPVIASYFTYFVIRPEARTNYGSLILPTRAMPELSPMPSCTGTPSSCCQRAEMASRLSIICFAARHASAA